MRLLAFLPLGLLVLLPVPAHSQYMFLDTNGDGVHDAGDQLAPSGPTAVDIWVVTNRNRDGTPVDCDVADAYLGLTINSYTVVLHASGGDVKWGPMHNRLPFAHEAYNFATYADTTDAGWYHNGWGSMDQFPPGKYRLATLQIETISGDPSISIEPYLPRHVVQITQFGTSCLALDGDNTYKLGLDWHDADGIGPPRADAGGPYEVQAGRTLQVDGSYSRTQSGAALSYHWDFGDGGSADGVRASHVYASSGDYTITLTIQGGGETDTDVTTAHVVPPSAPIARMFAPASAYVGIAANFDGSASYDPTRDALTYFWNFGDGTPPAQGIRVSHVFGTAGTYDVTLTVDDGGLWDSVTRSVVVYAVPHPPVASAGGPYSGVMGGLVLMNGTASSDPDGDALSYTWNFGDRTSGSGSVAGHAYEAPGVYTVRLTVSDGGLTNTAATTATIVESLPGRVFADGPAVWVQGQNTPIALHLESVAGSFRLQDVMVWPITMRSTGTGALAEIQSMEDATATPDSDGNGVPELTFSFSPEELALLFETAPPGTTAMVEIRGLFDQGGAFTATLPVRFEAPPSAPPAFVRLRISPNPFNPEAVVTFSTSKPGPVRAQLFDVRGRIVRTLLDGGALNAGRHVFPLEARNDDGGSLASGIYFFRLIGPDGTTTRRVSVAK